MSNLFASMGLEDVEADQNFIADGTWPAFIYESTTVTAKTGKNTGKPQWVITYKISEGKFSGKQQQEWFSLDPTNEKVKPWLKRRLLSLGVPESQHGSFNPPDVVGTAVMVKIATKDGYQNVRDVKEKDAATSTPNVSTDTKDLM